MESDRAVCPCSMTRLDSAAVHSKPLAGLIVHRMDIRDAIGSDVTSLHI
jgi:hypothetical protein